MRHLDLCWTSDSILGESLLDLILFFKSDRKPKLDPTKREFSIYRSLAIPDSVDLPAAPIHETELTLESTIRKLTSTPIVEDPGFRYIDLPTELRLQILGM
jgi:hypothetical protein